MTVKCDKCNNEAIIRLDKHNDEVKLNKQNTDETTAFCEDCYFKHVGNTTNTGVYNDSDLGYLDDDDW